MYCVTQGATTCPCMWCLNPIDEIYDLTFGIGATDDDMYRILKVLKNEHYL